MDNSFVELIKDIKKDDSKENIEKHYQECIIKLKEIEKRKFNDKSNINTIIKEKSSILLRMVYLQMFGRRFDSEYNFSLIDLLVSNKYFIKRRGFLILNNINDSNDIIFLSINLFKKELDKNIKKENNRSNLMLNSLTLLTSKINTDSIFNTKKKFKDKEDIEKKNITYGKDLAIDSKIFNTTLILNSISNICTDIMSANLYNDIILLMNSNYICVRKKTIVSFYKLVLCNLENLNIFLDFIKKYFVSFYNNEDTCYQNESGTSNDNMSNTQMCCLIINILLELFYALEKKYDYIKKENNLDKNIEQNENNLNNFIKFEKNINAKEKIETEKEENEKKNISQISLKKFLSFTPFIYNMLNDRLHLIDNWKLIKIIKFLKLLIKHENRIYKKFMPIIIHIFYTNKAKSIIFECFDFIVSNYKNSYNIDINLEKYMNKIPKTEYNEKNEKEEKINFEEKNIKQIGLLKEKDQINVTNEENNIEIEKNITPYGFKENNENVYSSSSTSIQVNNKNVDKNEKLNNLNENYNFLNFLLSCFKILLRYYFSDDKNIIYIATKLYISIFNNPDLFQIFVKYNYLSEFSHNILKNIYQEDLTIRNNLLHVLYHLINKKNFQSMAYNILIYIYNNELIYADEYINVILSYGKNNLEEIENVNMYIFILFYLICFNNNKHNDIIDQIITVNFKMKETHLTTIFLSCIYIITYGKIIMNNINDEYEITKDTNFNIKNEKYENNENIINIFYYLINHFKENEDFNKYDIFEYITIKLNIYKKIDQKKQGYKYINLNCPFIINILELLIYFIGIYIEETYEKIKEFKKKEFLNIFFFSLYLFFINYSTSIILWNILKIFLFFYQFKENDILKIYFQEFERHINLLIYEQNDIFKIDKCILLKNFLVILNNDRNSFNFYDYFKYTENIHIENYIHLNGLDLDKPYKYDDNFFYGKSQSQEKYSNKKYNQINQINVDENIQEKKEIVNEKIQEQYKLNNNYDEEHENNDELKLKKIINKHQIYIKEIEKKYFFLINENEHFRLYIQIQKENNILLLFLNFKNEQTFIQDFNIYGYGFEVINTEIKMKNDCTFNLFKFIDYEDNYYYKENQKKQEQNKIDEIINSSLKILNIENIKENCLISLKLKINNFTIKLSYTYLYNNEIFEYRNLNIPYVNIESLYLSIDEFKNVNKKKQFKIIAYQLYLEKKININKVIFNHFLFISEYLKIYFFNARNIYSNFQNNIDLNNLRIIFCMKNCSSTNILEEKIIILINTEFIKKEEINFIYDIIIKIKILNDSEEICNELLHYFEYILAQIFLQNIKFNYLFEI